LYKQHGPIDGVVFGVSISGYSSLHKSIVSPEIRPTCYESMVRVSFSKA